jgi:hypothetical protein
MPTFAQRDKRAGDDAADGGAQHALRRLQHVESPMSAPAVLLSLSYFVCSWMNETTEL